MPPHQSINPPGSAPPTGRSLPVGAPADPAGAARPGRTGIRRTQQERSSSTQLRLCQAALDLLVEVGYERLTTAQIARRAGVSKGAQAHHYRSKDDLLVAAYRHLLAQWDQRRSDYERALDDDASMQDLLQNMWRQVFGRPDFLASLEVMLASRHHPALRERLRELLRDWSVERDRNMARIVPLDDPDELATFMQLNICVLRGLAVYEGLAENQDLPRQVLEMWSGLATAFVAQRRRPCAARARDDVDREVDAGRDDARRADPPKRRGPASPRNR